MAGNLGGETCLYLQNVLFQAQNLKIIFFLRVNLIPGRKFVLYGQIDPRGPKSCHLETNVFWHKIVKNYLLLGFSPFNLTLTRQSVFTLLRNSPTFP